MFQIRSLQVNGKKEEDGLLVSWLPDGLLLEISKNKVKKTILQNLIVKVVNKHYYVFIIIFRLICIQIFIYVFVTVFFFFVHLIIL